MAIETNPYIEQENYFAGYEKSIHELKNHPDIVEFDKLCYEVFEHNEMGRKFIEFATKRFLVHSQITKGNPTYQLDVIWQEGFRDAYRMILNHIDSHRQRMKAESKSYA